MTKQQLKALLKTLSRFHGFLNIARDKVNIETWTENELFFVAISQQLELCKDRMTHTYIYNDISDSYDLAMID